MWKMKAPIIVLMVEDISAKSRSNTNRSEAEITDSDSDSSVYLPLQWVGVKNSGPPHRTKI
jgi:hypothetical protein